MRERQPMACPVGGREDGRRGRRVRRGRRRCWWPMCGRARARPGRCGRVPAPAPGYDRGEGRRRWRALDLGTHPGRAGGRRAAGALPRARGRRWRAVPWARHGAGHTCAFDEHGRLAGHPDARRRAVTELMRIAWRTVGSIIARVWADVEAAARPARRAAADRDRRDLLQARPQVPDRGRRPRHRPAGVGRAGPRPGHPAARSSTLLGPERCAQITHVSADGADWIDDVVAQRLPERGALRRPVPRRAVGHRGPRRGPPRRPGTTPADWPGRPRDAAGQARGRSPPRRPPAAPGPEGRPLRAVEEPREPHRADSAPSWTGSPRPTPGCTAPTCSRKASG